MTETRVWIAQCLCGPARHCIMANAAEADSNEAAVMTISWPLRRAVEEGLHTGLINPWCGLCHAPSHEWRYEVGRTRWATIEEATPALHENEAQQAAARAAFGDIPRSD